MSRNTDSHFGNSPMKTIRRSSFKMPYSYKTTGNTGEIIPTMTQEILPGDTFKVHTASLVRMLTPIAPVLDNAWLDTYFFFCPNRILWSHWREFMGENTTDAWTQEIQYTVPALTVPEGGWNKGTLGEKLYGIQGRAGGKELNALYARAYTLIFNEWFRNENVTEPADLSLGDATTSGSNGTDYVVDMQKGGCLAKAVKYADYFTRALPEPSKGPDIYLPLGQMAPVTTGLNDITPLNVPSFLRFKEYQNDPPGWVPASKGVLGFTESDIPALDGIAVNYNNTGEWQETAVVPVNLYADLANATAATINQLRQAFAVQRMYEIDARGGRAKACASSIKKSRKKTGRLNQMAS